MKRDGLERMMIDQSEQMMLVVDPASLAVVASNLTAQRMLGYGEEAIQEKPITDIESSLEALFYWEEVRGGQYQDIKLQDGLYCRADGVTFPVTKSIRRVEFEGKPLLLIQARDVSRERQAEEELGRTLSQLQATLESTGNGILVISAQGTIANMNRLFKVGS